MAELFGLGASAVAFIGLAGQVLQGCQYVQGFIENVRDAPDELRHYRKEILSFRCAVLGFQEVLQAIKPFARIENSADQALLALQSAGTAIDESKVFLQKFEQSGERELWRSIKFARKRSELAKYAARLGEVKVNILLAQSQVNLLLGLKDNSRRDQLQQTVTCLSSTSTAVLSQTAQAQNSVVELKKSTCEKFEELTAMHNSLNERLDVLGAALGPMVKVAVSNAVKELYSDPEDTGEYARSDSFQSSLASRAHLADRQQIWPTTFNAHQPPSTNSKAARQILHERTFWLWFATITLQSRSTTTQEMLSSAENEGRRIQETRRTRKRLNIILWILKKGILVSFERQFLGCTCLGADMRLRVSGIVSHHSPIATACRLGDFDTAYTLFQSGQASVFDSVKDYKVSLLGYTWFYLKESMRNRWIATAVESRVRDGLLEIFKFLATHGLDPGEPDQFVDPIEHQMSRLQQIFECAIVGHSPMSDLLELIRVIIANSQQDPFKAQSRYQGPLIKLACEMQPELAACINSQEQWDLRGCFEEDHSFPDNPFSTEHGYGSGTTYIEGSQAVFCIYSLVGDPDAIYLRAILYFKVTSCDLAYICRNSLENSLKLTETVGGCWDHAVKARVVACSEAGMDWLDDVSQCDAVIYGNFSLVEYFASHGSLHILEAAWLELGNDPGSFYTEFEGEIVSAIAHNLDGLRPARAWPQAENHRLRQERYDCSIGFFLDEAYRKFFPDDEEEIERIGYLRNLADDSESLPEINGLREDFWD